MCRQTIVTRRGLTIETWKKPINAGAGSGRKYKSCHMSFDNRIKDYQNRGYEVPDHQMIKTPEQIEGIGKRERETLWCWITFPHL